MRDETKVGLFILTGLLFLATAIFLLGDFSFKKHYKIYIAFKDVSGLAEKSNIRLNGVEVGKVKRIFIDKDRVMVELAVEEGIRIYRNSKFSIGSTSIIGSKFLQIDQGDPSSGIIKENETLYGENIVSIDKALSNTVQSLEKFINDINRKGDFAKNLNEVTANLRDITANLNEIISVSQPKIENSMDKFYNVMSKLESILKKVDIIATKIEKAEGPIGALISDSDSKSDLKQAVKNIKDTTASLKDTIGRASKIRTYWLGDIRYEPLSQYNMNSVGIKLYTRDNKYYYAGLSNFFNVANKDRYINYEIKNTAEAYMGWEWQKADFYVGAIRGSAGFGLRWKPMHENYLLNKFSLLVEANEFSRNRKIKDRKFDDPRIDTAIEFKINKNIQTGLRISDLLEVKRFSYTAKVLFEDKDISYLFGILGGGAYGAALK